MVYIGYGVAFVVGLVVGLLPLTELSWYEATVLNLVCTVMAALLTWLWTEGERKESEDGN